MENKVTDSSEYPDLSHHEYYLINGLVRRIGAKVTHFAETPKRLRDKVSDFIKDLTFYTGGE